MTLQDLKRNNRIKPSDRIIAMLYNNSGMPADALVAVLHYKPDTIHKELENLKEQKLARRQKFSWSLTKMGETKYKSLLKGGKKI